MATVNAERLLGDLYRLREFGAYKTGVHRPTYSEIDMASRRWLVERMGEAGLRAEIDGIGDIVGRSPAPGPKLLIGSHSESQNHAGWLDGALGVIYGLEVARAVAEDPDLAGCGVDAAVWADEEGHFRSMIGSRSFIGDLDDAEIDALRNQYDGTPLRSALEAAGLAGRPRTRIEPGRHIGFLEAHIEQGDSLE
ncbi:MAG: M28 family peptidase, partial [Alphaproteobacteria bacterium]